MSRPSISQCTANSHRPGHPPAGRLVSLLLVGAALALSGGCGSDAKTPAATAPAVGLAILASDYAVSTISLYDPEKRTVRDACVHSGSSSAVLAQPLSGDVTLPSEPQLGGELVLIDRKNAALTFVDPVSCTARAQISVSTGGFKANPRDIITVSAHKAYVTRYETNATATDDQTDFDEGDDLLVIDPQAVAGTAPVLNRIPLSSYATTVDGAVIQARPDRGVFAGGKVYVTLGNLNANLSAAGAGRVVAIDPVTDTVLATIDLPPTQKGCSGIFYAGDTNRLYVSCGGPFGDPAQAAASGLVEIDLSGTAPTSKVVVAAGAVGGLPLNFSYAATLGQVAFVGTFGVIDSNTGAVITPDAFYAVNGLPGGVATKLLDGGAFNLGRAAIDARRKTVYLPDGDGTMPLVHVFDASVDPPLPQATFDSNPSAHLVPREIAWY